MFPRSQYLLRQISCAGAILATLVATPIFAAGPKAYVGNFKDNTVSVIDTGAGKVVATVSVAAGPHGMAITQDGRTVYVSGDGSSSLDVIDTATDKVVKTIRRRQGAERRGAHARQPAAAGHGLRREPCRLH